MFLNTLYCYYLEFAYSWAQKIKFLMKCIVFVASLFKSLFPFFKHRLQEMVLKTRPPKNLGKITYLYYFRTCFKQMR